MGSNINQFHGRMMIWLCMAVVIHGSPYMDMAAGAQIFTGALI